jgi:hypothetical protein
MIRILALSGSGSFTPPLPPSNITPAISRAILIAWLVSGSIT